MSEKQEVLPWNMNRNAADKGSNQKMRKNSWKNRNMFAKMNRGKS